MSNKFAIASGELINLDEFLEGISSYTLDDIAHGLAKIQRYNGASPPLDVFYSVAEHSINLTNAIGGSIEDMRATILHDASEFILADLPSYLKKYLPQYVELEKKVQEKIYMKYLGKVPKCDKLHEYDKRIVLDEIKAFDTRKLLIYTRENPYKKELGCKIWFNASQKDVKRKFLEICELLNIKE